MKVSEIVIATGGKLISGDETMEITGFSQDSRQAVGRDDVYSNYW